MLGKKNASHEPKVLEVDASLQGNLVFKDPVKLIINGSFEGRLETKGELTIGEHAVVKADILGDRITISGKVNGNITAASEIRLTATAQGIGDVQAPSLAIDKGGVLQGTSRMLPAEEVSQHARRVLMNMEEVAHYLSVERELVTEWAENGKLPGVKDGVGWQFEKKRVDQWIANGRIT